MSGASNLDFSTGPLVDPTKALSNALDNASDTIGAISKQYLENERYKQDLELRKQQEQRANSLFNMQMDEANRKKQAYQATQDFARNYDPNQANTAWAQNKLADLVAARAGAASTIGMGPDMFFDEADRQNYINQSTEAARKSMVDPTQTSDIAQARQELVKAFGSTIDRPTAEANARRAALKAGVPIENVDAVIKSLGPLGIDYIAQNRIAQYQRNKDIAHYTNLLENMTPRGKGGTGMGASFSGMGNVNTLHNTITSFADTSWNPLHSGSERAQDNANAIINADNMTFTDANGHVKAATMPQRIAAANLVLMMNRAGPNGQYMNLDATEAQTLAREYIANGTVDERGNIVNTGTVTNLQNKLRTLIETPHTDFMVSSRDAIKKVLQSGVNTGFSDSIHSGRGATSPSTSPSTSSTPTKSVLTPPKDGSTPLQRLSALNGYANISDKAPLLDNLKIMLANNTLYDPVVANQLVASLKSKGINDTTIKNLSEQAKSSRNLIELIKANELGSGTGLGASLDNIKDTVTGLGQIANLGIHGVTGSLGAIKNVLFNRATADQARQQLVDTLTPYKNAIDATDQKLANRERVVFLSKGSTKDQLNALRDYYKVTPENTQNKPAPLSPQEAWLNNPVLNNPIDLLKENTSPQNNKATAPYDVLYNNIDPKRIGLDKPITSSTLGELIEPSKKMIDLTRGTLKGQPDNVGTSAMGAYQMTKGFREDWGKATFGDNWKNVKFTPENQQKMIDTYIDTQIKKGNYSDILAKFEGIKKAGLTPSDLKRMTPEQIKIAIKATESGGGLASLAWYNG